MLAEARRVRQRQDALVRANTVRLARAKAKRAVASGTLSAEDVVASPAPHLRGMAVRDLLLSVRGVGPARADGMLRAAGVGQARDLGGLTGRQRVVLRRALEGVRHGG